MIFALFLRNELAKDFEADAATFGRAAMALAHNVRTIARLTNGRPITGKPLLPDCAANCVERFCNQKPPASTAQSLVTAYPPRSRNPGKVRLEPSGPPPNRTRVPG